MAKPEMEIEIKFNTSLLKENTDLLKIELENHRSARKALKDTILHLHRQLANEAVKSEHLRREKNSYKKHYDDVFDDREKLKEEIKLLRNLYRT